jgi:hypothetical protein
LSSPYTVQSGDYIGAVDFQGYDSNSYENAASIRCSVDGTPGDGDMPGRLSFWTSPDGSTTIAERMRITNAGYIGISEVAPAALLEVSKPYVSLVAEEAARFTVTGRTAGGALSTVTMISFEDGNNPTLVGGVGGIRHNSGADYGGGLAFYTNNAATGQITAIASLIQQGVIFHNGIVQWNNQSRASAYKSTTTQIVATATVTPVEFNAESFDAQSEFYSTTKTGTATSTSANHLVDTGATFVTGDVSAGGDVAKYVWNTTDNTYTRVSAFNSSTDLTLVDNIMANGETYRLFGACFIPLQTGYYQFTGAIHWGSSVDQSSHYLYFSENWTSKQRIDARSSGTGDFSQSFSVCFYCTAANAYRIFAYQSTGGNVNIDAGSDVTYFNVHKLS